MHRIYILLFYEFLKTGAFAIGGGYATLPFLFYIQTTYGWFSIDELTNMIAVSNITPGPIGINMATYTGYTTAGIFGSLITTFAIILIPFIASVITLKILDKYKNTQTLNYIFIGLRAASCALLTSIALKLLYQTSDINIVNSDFQADYKAIILFFILIIPFLFIKKNPILILLFGAIGGIIIKSL